MSCLNELARGTDKGRRFSDASAAKDRAAWRVLKRYYPDKTEGQCREIIRSWVKTGLLFTEKY
jgi:hypothetical protein